MDPMEALKAALDGHAEGRRAYNDWVRRMGWKASVSIDPSTDLWMRGVRHAMVDVVGTKWVNVTHPASGKTFRVAPQFVEVDMVGTPGWVSNKHDVGHPDYSMPLVWVSNWHGVWEYGVTGRTLLPWNTAQRLAALAMNEMLPRPDGPWRAWHAGEMRRHLKYQDPAMPSGAFVRTWSGRLTGDAFAAGSGGFRCEHNERLLLRVEPVTKQVWDASDFELALMYGTAEQQSWFLGYVKTEGVGQ